MVEMEVIKIPITVGSNAFNGNGGSGGRADGGIVNGENGGMAMNGEPLGTFGRTSGNGNAGKRR